MRKLNRAVLAGSVVLALSVAGCSTKGASTSSDGSGSGSVKTDIGVTADTINLGVMTDTSGVFKVLGLSVTNANKMWAEDIHAAGGICGRKIALDVQDTGYAADKAVTLYAGMKQKDAGLLQLIGSPILAALKSQIVADSMLSIPLSWASTNLDADAVFMVGATYDIEMLNGLSFMQKEGKLKDGDKIGHIYIGSEYGNNGLQGSKAYAQAHNQTVVEAKVGASDADMTSIITDMKSKGVNLVVLTGTPAQLGSVATQMAAQGLDVPILGSNPTFDPQLLKTPAKDALGSYYRVGGVLPYGAPNNAETAEIAKKFKASGTTEAPTDGVNFGYAMGLAYQKVLEQACKNGDMTRAGIVKAKGQVQVDTKDLTGKLDFSKKGQPSTRESIIEQADPAAEGGLKVIQELTASDEAKNYKTPAQK